ncbi:MAG: 2-amino-4-hydroxy-6-hydroxymethyldihydropteridinepyrophosphokinae [Verrucomicrobiota bacterium]|jgi:2-amino-4-hydroxy-6-hydroxymethyldihydropteridine diphosphokinase
MPPVYIAFGSNVDPLVHLDAAFRSLAQASRLEAVSSLWETEALGPARGQAPFVNGVCRLRSELAPAALKALLQEIEAAHGHPPGIGKEAPRTLDLDLILCGRENSSIPSLRLPHPQLFSRDFVYRPVLELDPECRLPDGRLLRDCIPPNSNYPHRLVRPMTIHPE